VIPIDFDGPYERAIETALRLCDEESTVVHLLTIVPANASGDERDVAEFYRRLCAQARARLDAITSELRESGHEVVVRVDVGDVIEVITNYVATLDDVVLVIALDAYDLNHPPRAQARVTEQVAARLGCSVLLAK